MNTVVSKDGTHIAYSKQGEGPVIILVDGAMGYQGFGPMVGLAPLLAKEFTVIHYDRRGRGKSGDTQPYSPAREIEDLETIIEAEGGKAAVFGSSSGAVFSAMAASHLGKDRITKLTLHEPSFILDGSHAPVPSNYLDSLRQMLKEGRRGDMVALFMTDAVGMPAEMVEGMKHAPFWTTMEAVAPTLIYEAIYMTPNQKGKPLSSDMRKIFEAIEVPTLIIDGTASYPFLHSTADILAKVIPSAQHKTIEGMTHDFDAASIAPALISFLKTQ